MLSAAVLPAMAINQVEDNNEMEDIVLESTDERCVIVSVPLNVADEYQERINNDPDFARTEIETALLVLNGGARSLPDGHIQYQSYMYIDDIRDAVDSYSGKGTFNNFMTVVGWAATAANIKGLIKLSGYASATLLGANILGTIFSWAQQEREQWWINAERDICNGDISSVRYTIVQNTSEYSKVWRVFERMD